MINRQRILLICSVITWTAVAVVVSERLSAQGKVYLVLGSDTAIWDGMDVGRHDCTYRTDLYTAMSQNAYRVMASSFRERLVDSYGRPMKLTWWMMGGNIFRYATNKNVPVPNPMTLHLMQKYHGAAIRQFGDELSLHYHTFAWTDYDRDGKPYWNQATTFEECREDFDVTLAQYLLEENIYPVSFRSGWHAMDNGWQRYLDELLPFCMHNDWPAKRSDPTEPIDNVYDWSRTPNTWVPFHPSPDDYQIPGACRGWNLRSKHIGSVDARLMDTLFARAKRGVDQVACLWGHLPETDFLQNLEKIDSLAHQSATRIPGVDFLYCTAVEAMQRWLRTTDDEPPEILLLEEYHGNMVYYMVRTNEPIFQKQPFLAIKDVNERAFVAPCVPIGPKTWRSVYSYSKNELAKVAVAVTDTVGNLKTEFIRYLPDDLYVDDLDPGYEELRGTWVTVPGSTWGTTSRVAAVTPGDSVNVRWQAQIDRSTRYNIFVQLPQVSNPAKGLVFRIYRGNTPADTVRFQSSLPHNEWIFLSSLSLTAGETCSVDLSVLSSDPTTTNVGVDVVKISPLVRERQLVASPQELDFGEVSEGEAVTRDLLLSNFGVGVLTVSGVSSTFAALSSSGSFPFGIPAMSSFSIPVSFLATLLGHRSDTLWVLSDDPLEPRLPIAVTASVLSYFSVVDNEDSTRYVEVGQWARSNAQAFGPSSRYAFVSTVPRASATFSTVLKKSGVYDIKEIVPQTANAADRALYVVSASGQPIDSIVIDQNQGSGGWVTVCRCQLPAAATVTVRVVDTGRNTAGRVLRADALKFVWVDGVTSTVDQPQAPKPEEFVVYQNYPNPFSAGGGSAFGGNSGTTMRFWLPSKGSVRITVLNTLGQEVGKLVEGEYEAGYHSTYWQATRMASGVYFYRFEATLAGAPGGSITGVRRMLLLK